MSKALRKACFYFAGATTMYAFMQDTGMVDENSVDCWRAVLPGGSI
jgi:DNA-3-methyladenine glycosylase I